MLIVCDLDGTLSDCRHRNHLAVAGDWDAFHAGLSEDPVHNVVLTVLTELITAGHELVFLTGRPEDNRSATQTWLAAKCAFHEGDEYIDILMRPKSDSRKDAELKLDLLQSWFSAYDQAHSLEITLILEDREALVAMWRDQGYICFQTAQGAF